MKVILHTGNTRKNLPKTYFSLLKNRNLNTFPLLLPAEKNGRVQIKLLRKKNHKISCPHSALKYPKSFQT